VPLLARNGNQLGLILLSDRVEDDFTPEDEAALVHLAQMAAVAVENIRLSNRVREAGGQKEAFLAMLAHELRNPLAPLRNAMQLLRLQTDPETVGWARDVIERQVLHLSRMVDDLLDSSRVARGQIKLQRVPVELTNLVRLTIQDHQASLEAAGLALKPEVSAEPMWVHGDPIRLAQVLSNLLHNAAKFTEAGGQIALQLAPEEGWARLSVTDTGRGIEPKLLPHIFESLTQADRSLERSKGGLGLGLALVKGLVELHGGRVAAASEGVNRGTAVTVWLPLAPTPASSPLPAASRQLAVRCLRVLIIEDNADAAASLAALLGVYGHQAEVAYTGPDGVEAVARFSPDVVLCDLGLPGISGFEVARLLRADPKNARLHLIAVSGYGQEEDHQTALAAGFDQALVKPVDPESLRHLLAGL
jgi:signal transduction histidine kinase